MRLGIHALLAAGAVGAAAQTTQEFYIAPNYIIASSPSTDPVNISVVSQDVSLQNDTAPMLYGLMFEDINHSGDGGIYAEALINRDFQGTPINANDNPIVPYGPVLTGWSAIGNISLSLDLFHPLSDSLPVALMVTIPENTTGTVGLMNTGWWGINVAPGTYNASFFVNAVNKTYHAANMTTFTAALQSNETGEVWANSTIDPFHIDTFHYSQVNTSFYNSATAPDGNNSFTLTWDGAALSGQTLYFSLFSLFPETFKNRPNGLRKDLAQALYDMKPGFLRCPGGNNIEGQTVYDRWKWYETIGPLQNRKGRIGDWGYWNTNGLGLMEYMYWCEDMDMEPVLAIYAGYSLDGTSYPEMYMDEVLQEAMDELEFLMGDTSTKWGAKRAEYGRAEPFQINYVEVGNEDWFSCTYQYRFDYLYSALKKAYPNVHFITTQSNENGGNATQNGCPPANVSIPAGESTDLHNYQPPSYYLNTFGLWDNYAEANGYTEGQQVQLMEYSVLQLDTSTEANNFNFAQAAAYHPLYPQMIHAIGEGVYQLSMERNPNLIRLAAYAPGFQNRNNFAWTPNMISYVAEYNLTVLSTSYYQQKLFNAHRGTQSVPVYGDLNPLYWAASIDNSTGVVYLKVINTGNNTIPLTMNFDSKFYSVNGTMLQSDDPNGFNFANNATAISPQPITDLPTPGSSNTTASATPTPTSMSVGSTTTANGEGVTTMNSTVSATSASSTGAAAKRQDVWKRWDNGTDVWSWEVPMFGSFVLQFNP